VASRPRGRSTGVPRRHALFQRQHHRVDASATGHRRAPEVRALRSILVEPRPRNTAPRTASHPRRQTRARGGDRMDHDAGPPTFGARWRPRSTACEPLSAGWPDHSASVPASRRPLQRKRGRARHDDRHRAQDPGRVRSLPHREPNRSQGRGQNLEGTTTEHNRLGSQGGGRRTRRNSVDSRHGRLAQLAEHRPHMLRRG
jgi:hypothetical protein